MEVYRNLNTYRIGVGMHGQKENTTQVMSRDGTGAGHVWAEIKQMWVCMQRSGFGEDSRCENRRRVCTGLSYNKERVYMGVR